MSENEPTAKPTLVLGLTRSDPLDERLAAQCLEESVGAIASLVGTQGIFFWSRVEQRVVPLRRDGGVACLRGTSLFQGKDPFVSHSVGLQRSPAPSLPDGTIVLRIGHASSQVGRLELRHISAALPVAQLRAAFEQLVRIWGAARAWLGPASAAKRRLGWLTFEKNATHETLRGLKVERLLGGTLVEAHAEEPASESAVALAGYEEVSLRLHPSDVPGSTERREAPFAQPRSSGQISQPSPSVLRGTAAVEPESVLDETLPFVAGSVLGDVMPFAGTTTPVRLSELKAETAQARAPSESVDETLMIRSPLLPDPEAAGSFRDQLTPTAVPDISLEEYAHFRALLRVHGEDHQPTWQMFGVLSRASKDALQSRFSALFRRDSETQGRFLALLEERLAGPSPKR